jgi:hypothetical protein
MVCAEGGGQAIVGTEKTEEVGQCGVFALEEGRSKGRGQCGDWR